MAFNDSMRIGILCFRSYDSYDFKSEEFLKEAALERGHEGVLIHVPELSLTPEGDVFCSGAPLGDFDGFISRARVVDQVENRLFWVKILEDKGYKVINGYKALIQSKNKWIATDVLRKAGVPTVPTWIVEDESIAIDTAKKIAYPVVIKAPYGTFGLSVEKAENEEKLKEVLWKFWKPNFIVPLLFQPFVKEADGKDFRVNVVGTKVVGTFLQTASAGEFRANLNLGGISTPYEITPELESLALRAVASLGLDFAGVDVIQTQNGLAVLEVNANPDFLVLKKIALGAIIELAVSRFQKS